MTIKEILSKHENIAVGFSGGKDSTVVLDLVRKIRPDAIAVFCNTGVEHKLTYEYIRRVPNVIWLKPEKTFWQCIEEYGFPVSKIKAHSYGNRCCYWLKERPMINFVKENNIDLVVDGLTIAESRQRMMFLKHYGKYHFVKSWNVHKFHPIAEWTPEQVGEYIYENNLDYNKIYDPPVNAERCGCQPCTAYCSWKERLAHENFKLYAMIQHKFMQQSLMSDFQEREVHQ